MMPVAIGGVHTTRAVAWSLLKITKTSQGAYVYSTYACPNGHREVFYRDLSVRADKVVGECNSCTRHEEYQMMGSSYSYDSKTDKLLKR